MFVCLCQVEFHKCWYNIYWLATFNVKRCTKELVEKADHPCNFSNYVPHGVWDRAVALQSKGQWFDSRCRKIEKVVIPDENSWTLTNCKTSFRWLSGHWVTMYCKFLNASFECNDIVIFIYSHYPFVQNTKKIH